MQIGLGERREGEEEEGCEGEEEKKGLWERSLKPEICIIFIFLYYTRFFVCCTSPNPRGRKGRGGGPKGRREASLLPSL